MRFLIIENTRGDLDLLRLRLGQCFTDSVVVPLPGKITSTWKQAKALVGSEGQDKPEQVVFLDLALESNETADARAGLQQVRQLIAQCPTATWIAYTSYNELVESNDWKNLFQGVLNKQEWSKREQDEDYVRRVVESSLRKSRGIGDHTTFNHEDSAGMRSVFANYSKEALEQLTATECQGWKEVNMSALSSGYSGSSLLLITGTKDSAPRQLVAKLAMRKSTIQKECQALDNFKAELGALVGRFARPSPPIELSEHSGFYSIQEAASGETLLSLLTDKKRSYDSALTTVTRLEVSQYGHKWQADDEIEKKLRRFHLNQIDLHRARQSRGFLEEISVHLKKRGTWPPSFVTPKKLFKEIGRCLESWPDLIRRTPPLWWVLQHGDLNTRNVIIGEAGQVTFIDLQRLDHWPVGYDLARLAIQLRIRLVDRASGVEWIENRLTQWFAEPVFALRERIDPVSSICPPAAFCEKALREFIDAQDSAEHESLLIGARLAALFDMLRILSYGDLSPFKKLWVAVSCFELISGLKG
ncbi:MAG TPA: aminoglycoside phosphotransferase family protein [Blastocatellia bacterium]|nr:aminoglycoside phosphotransferase family protein [Blastocatellia bacterium]